MYTSVEIEFKTKISKDEYEKLIKLFDLKDKIFSQTNYYFDTPNRSLIENGIIQIKITVMEIVDIIIEIMVIMKEIYRLALKLFKLHKKLKIQKNMNLNLV